MDVESRFAEILQIKDRQEEAVAIRKLMDDIASGAHGHVNSFYVFNLAEQHLRDHPELGLECYYLSMFLNSKAFEEGREAAAHDVDYIIGFALSLPEVKAIDIGKTINALEEKYGIYIFGPKK